MVIVEATPVNRFGVDLTAETLEPLVNAIHEGGSPAAIQMLPVTWRRSVVPADLTPGEIEEIVAHYRTAAGVCAEAGSDGLNLTVPMVTC